MLELIVMNAMRKFLDDKGIAPTTFTAKANKLIEGFALLSERVFHFSPLHGIGFDADAQLSKEAPIFRVLLTLRILYG